MGPAERLAWLAHLEACDECRFAFGKAAGELATISDHASLGSGGAGVPEDAVPGTIAGEPRAVAPVATIGRLPDGEPTSVDGVTSTIGDAEGSLSETMVTLAPREQDPYLTLCPDVSSEAEPVSGWSRPRRVCHRVARGGRLLETRRGRRSPATS